MVIWRYILWKNHRRLDIFHPLLVLLTSVISKWHISSTSSWQNWIYRISAGFISLFKVWLQGFSIATPLPQDTLKTQIQSARRRETLTFRPLYWSSSTRSYISFEHTVHTAHTQHTQHTNLSPSRHEPWWPQGCYLKLWRAHSRATEDIVQLFSQAVYNSLWLVNWPICLKSAEFPFNSLELPKRGHPFCLWRIHEWRWLGTYLLSLMAYHQDMHTDKQILLGSYNILLFIIQYMNS